MGLFLMTSGLGSYVASAIVAIVKAASDGGEWIFFLIGYSESCK